jgi:protein-S-isoprenylcysteine O-methyltransferase Ste14
MTALRDSHLMGWQKIARRIRVPLGFVAAGFYIWQLFHHAPELRMVLWSLALVLPGLWLRGYASGYVQKNKRLTVTGPYAYVRNPLYLGSILMAAGFALALGSVPFTAILLVGFLIIYIPVIASEEAFLRVTFPEFTAYCKQVPRILPRLTPARLPWVDAEELGEGRFSFGRYRKHREYNSAIGAVLLYWTMVLGMLLRSGH